MVNVVQPKHVEIYVRKNGACPFRAWLKKLKDHQARASIIQRIDRLERGLFGDYHDVGEGILELRFHVGPGYRVYCGQSGASLIVLLIGGDKRSQKRDIELAKTLWSEFKERV